MRIAVLSDTHGKQEPTKAALEQIRSQNVEAILHCGDIGSTELVECFAGWPTHFVFGNVDQNRDRFERTIREAGQFCHGDFGDITLGTLGETRIAFLHGDDRPRLSQTIASGKWNLVCSGHTHKMETRREGSTIILNPGALYRAQPRTFALVELPALDIQFVEVSG